MISVSQETSCHQLRMKTMTILLNQQFRKAPRLMIYTAKLIKRLNESEKSIKTSKIVLAWLPPLRNWLKTRSSLNQEMKLKLYQHELLKLMIPRTR